MYLSEARLELAPRLWNLGLPSGLHRLHGPVELSPVLFVLAYNYVLPRTGSYLKRPILPHSLRYILTDSFHIAFPAFKDLIIRCSASLASHRRDTLVKGT
jgi:hypothetical protein